MKTSHKHPSLLGAKDDKDYPKVGKCLIQSAFGQYCHKHSDCENEEKCEDMMCVRGHGEGFCKIVKDCKSPCSGPGCDAWAVCWKGRYK